MGIFRYAARHSALKFALLTTAVALILLCLVALACAPAAPAGQGGTLENPVETKAAPTSILTAAPTHEGWDGLGMPPPTPTLTQMERQYPNLGGHFIRKIQQYEAATARSSRTSASSGQPTPTPQVMRLIITIDSHDRVDDVQYFLEENGASQIKCLKFPSDYIIPGECVAAVPVSLLRGLAEQLGVAQIEVEPTIEPGTSKPTTMIISGTGSVAEALLHGTALEMARHHFIYLLTVSIAPCMYWMML